MSPKIILYLTSIVSQRSDIIGYCIWVRVAYIKIFWRDDETKTGISPEIEQQDIFFKRQTLLQNVDHSHNFDEEEINGTHGLKAEIF